jgi:putative endonuclease
LFVSAGNKKSPTAQQQALILLSPPFVINDRRELIRSPLLRKPHLRLFLLILFMYYVYILYSLKDGNLYKGYTSYIQNRFLKHNSGGSKSTAHRKPFVMVYVEQFDNKRKALLSEQYFKSLEGGAELKEELKRLRILNEDNKLNLEHW